MTKGGNKGFTIVETLIVLAIAATIIVVVLLAVPVLQRSSRNTSVRTAANNVVSGWNEQISLTGGSPSVQPSGYIGSVTINTTSYKIAGSVTPNIFTSNSNSNVIFDKSLTSASYGVSMTLAPNNLLIIWKATCSAGVISQGTALQLAVVYPIENGGSGSVGCIQG